MSEGLEGMLKKDMAERDPMSATLVLPTREELQPTLGCQ